MAQCGPLTVNCLPVQVRKTAFRTSSVSNGLVRLGENGIVPLDVVEKQHILNAYQITGENKSQTARLLKIGLNTLRRKLKSYGI